MLIVLLFDSNAVEEIPCLVNSYSIFCVDYCVKEELSIFFAGIFHVKIIIDKGEDKICSMLVGLQLKCLL